MDADPRTGDAPRRFGLLFITTFLLVGVQGVASPGDVQQVAVTVLAGGSLLLALRTAELSGRTMRLAAGAVVVLVGLSVLRAVTGDIGEGTARLMNAALIALAPPAVVIGIARELRSTDHVRLEAVMGVLSLYLLIGTLFAFVYGALDRFADEAFFAGGDAASVSNCIYFSFTTLTTTGYGDLASGTELGRTLSIFEALIGQIYLVTVVSLIVSNLGHPARRARS